MFWKSKWFLFSSLINSGLLSMKIEMNLGSTVGKVQRFSCSPWQGEVTGPQGLGNIPCATASPAFGSQYFRKIKKKSHRETCPKHDLPHHAHITRTCCMGTCVHVSTAEDRLPASRNSCTADKRHPVLSAPHTGKGESSWVKIIVLV